MILFHLSSSWLSNLYITKNCVFCWYTTAEKQKLEPRRFLFEAMVFNQEQLLYCTQSLYRLTKSIIKICGGYLQIKNNYHWLLATHLSYQCPSLVPKRCVSAMKNAKNRPSHYRVKPSLVYFKISYNVLVKFECKWQNKTSPKLKPD